MSRPIYSTEEHGKLKIIYHAVVDDSGLDCALKIWGCIVPCTCFCYEPLRKAIKESTYVQVLENRIEWNVPYSYCTGDLLCPWRVNCHMVDNTKVLYFDRALAAHAQEAGMCSPACTHNDCIPTCCDMCGQTLVMYEEVPSCQGCRECCTCCHVYNSSASVGQRPRTCCSASHVKVECLKDAKHLAEAINKARDTRLKQLSAFIHFLHRG